MEKTAARKHKNFLHDLGMRWRIFIYLLGFAIIMIILLWLFQIVYLDQFYEQTKRDQIESAYNNISQHLDDDDLADYTKDIALMYNICVDVYTLDRTNGLLFGVEKIVSVDILGDCIIHHMAEIEKARLYSEAEVNPEGYMQIFSRLSFNHFESLDSDTELTITKDDSLSKSLVYSRLATDREGNSYLLLLNSTITPVSATVAALRAQLVIISVILIILALVISFIIARRLSRPIRKLNVAAKKMAKGDLTVNFPAEGYKEISELADTLNYASSELARTDALQKDIVANISHDIRTPLTMISGYAEFMRDFPDEDHSESIEVIVNETERLRDLVNDILDSSRISAGVSSIEPHVFNFTESLAGFISNYNHLMEFKGYRIDFEADTVVWLNADERRMLQAIGNMLNNALTHIGEDKLIIVRQLVKGDTMRVEISDHGCGIPQEDIPHIWERYYRTDAPAKGNHGSGLGLSIVKGIFDMHGAKYGVISKIGEGSTFWFEMKIILPESKNRFKGFRNQWRKGQEQPKKEKPKKEHAKKDSDKINDLQDGKFTAEQASEGQGSTDNSSQTAANTPPWAGANSSQSNNQAANNQNSPGTDDPPSATTNSEK